MPSTSSHRKAGRSGVSAEEFRASLAMFATGVTIVTARTPTGEMIGLTANSFNSVSLNPPLVLWSLAQAASSMGVLSVGSHYAINILAADQKALAERFAGRLENRWTEIPVSPRVLVRHQHGPDSVRLEFCPSLRKAKLFSLSY